MNDRVAVAPQLRVQRFETLNQLERFGGCVALERIAKKVIETFGAPRSFETVFERTQRR